MKVQRRYLEIGAALIALALLATFAFLLLQADGLRLANGQPVFGDFIAFWSAGRAALEGHAAQVHDHGLIAEYNRLAAPGVSYYAPWNSPPTFLLVAASASVFSTCGSFFIDRNGSPAGAYLWRLGHA